MPSHTKSYPVRRPWIAFLAGALIGMLGGLIGLGGAEFRLPVLISTFALLPHRAVRFNLLVSLVTLAFACLTRLSLLPETDLRSFADEAAAMIAGGMLAAWLGAGLLKRLSPVRLMATISVLLMGISGLLVAEAAASTSLSVELPDQWGTRVACGLLAGLLVGAVSSLLGVAGGELIIPSLILLFGADLRTAGTLSILISLPIVIVGVVKHRLSGHYRSSDVLLHLVAPMGFGSILGAAIGAYASASAPIALLKVVLALILAVSAVKLWRKSAEHTE